MYVFSCCGKIGGMGDGIEPSWIFEPSNPMMGYIIFIYILQH